MSTNLPASFEKLRIWQEAHQLMIICHGLANKLPFNERSDADQINRSSASVPANIAESQGTYYFNDKLKALYVARKEATETQSHLKKIQSGGNLSTSECDSLISRYQGLIIGINKFAHKVIEQRDKYQNSAHSAKSSQSA